MTKFHNALPYIRHSRFAKVYYLQFFDDILLYIFKQLKPQYSKALKNVYFTTFISLLFVLLIILFVFNFSISFGPLSQEDKN